jgi:hypothetical protein
VSATFHLSRRLTAKGAKAAQISYLVVKEQNAEKSSESLRFVTSSSSCFVVIVTLGCTCKPILRISKKIFAVVSATY